MKDSNKIKKDLKLQYIGFKENNKICTAGLGFGIASAMLTGIGIIPLTGIIISIFGIVTFNKEKEKNLWMGVVGLVINCLYMLNNAQLYGHI